MTRDQLEHALRAAAVVAEDTEFWVFGSQSVLGQMPDAPAALRVSFEVDLDPKNRPDRVDHIDGALGEGSRFHQTHGFYVHGVSIKAATLPRGWKGRTVKVANPNTHGAVGLCLEVHDLACSKLAAFREKDREFVRTLVREKLVKPNRLTTQINLLPLPAEHRRRLIAWVDATARDLRR